MDDVIEYFKGIKSIIGEKFKIGVYGSGMTADRLLKKKGLIHSNWIAKSPKWWGTQAFYNSGRCNLFQYSHMVKVPQFKTIEGVDCNIAYEPLSSFGFWGAPLHKDADEENKQLLNLLMFISSKKFVIHEGASDSSKILLKVSNGSDGIITARTVKILEKKDEWTKILFSDEFTKPKRKFITRIGFCRSSTLTEYKKMPVF